jgi:betaine-aldehyde dehydrogenase
VEAADGERRDVISPGDGQVVTSVSWAGDEDVNRAVAAASNAFEAWRFTDILVRRAALLELATSLRADAEALGYLDAVDSGNPIKAMESDVGLAAIFVDYLAGLAFSWGGRQIPAMGRAIDFTMREPYGVTARIIPYNHPILFAGWKIAAPLLTGNTVVLKLPDQTPLSGLRLAERLAEIFPPGVINVITGDGATAGDALTRHPDVARIAFIGSVPTGRKILHAAAERIVPVTVELGGKNPMIVCPDADVDTAMAAAVKGMNFAWCQGQSCGSYSRLFLHEAIYDEAIEKLVAEVEQLKVRHPLDRDGDMGAMVTEGALAKSQHYIAGALDQGAHVVSGGSSPSGVEFDGGWYLEPTVVGGVDQSMTIANEEIFGPVQSVLRWSDEDQVIRDANSTEYGLTGNVWTNDINRAFRMAERLDSGSIAINGDGSQHWVGIPFGGFKSSGIGKEENLEEVVATTREKNIYVNLASS